MTLVSHIAIRWLDGSPKIMHGLRSCHLLLRGYDGEDGLKWIETKNHQNQERMTCQNMCLLSLLKIEFISLPQGFQGTREHGLKIIGNMDPPPPPPPLGGPHHLIYRINPGPGFIQLRKGFFG